MEKRMELLERSAFAAIAAIIEGFARVFLGSRKKENMIRSDFLRGRG